MKMVDEAFSLTGWDLSMLDTLAVALGPGSYTGVRIGIACVKGMAHAKKMKCFGISTLESMAYSALNSDFMICSVMDARCQQVYTALFTSTPDGISRYSGDLAIPTEQLVSMLYEVSREKSIYLVGDGADLLYGQLDSSLKSKTFLAPPHLRMQRAGSLATAAFNLRDREDLFFSYEDLNPIYLRPSQAERNLKRSQE